MQTGSFTKNNELLERALQGDENAKDELILANMGLVRSIANRFRDRIDGSSDSHGCDYEDLIQIGTVGMIKAIRSFDTSFGTAFSTYAVPLIIGEIKRFLRDDGLIKISRITKKQNAMILHVKEKFVSENSREPTIDELSELCKLSKEDLVFAMTSGTPCHSLNSAIGDDGTEFEEIIPSSENEIETLTDRLALKQAVELLPFEEREIIRLRYFHDLSQQQTAEILGLSQVKISREEKKIFNKLRLLL